MLNAIKYIDEVVTFGSLEEQLICMEKSGAKTLVIGSDYKDKPVVGEDRMEVIYFDRVDDFLQQILYRKRIYVCMDIDLSKRKSRVF